ncbi:alpha/beta hydrolase-fold protein [Paenibacillus glucanolyticus]|uniref:alpha/beta hydrolase n=1 Tax=Paenibacillus glucanolyticus TaxID=59843 RepID=UPI0030C9CF9A
MIDNRPVPWREVFIDEVTHTITGNVQIYESFPIPQLRTERRIWIYLPRSYNESNRSFPVYYMQDGQNVFDQATSWGCEWGVDETLEQMALEDPSLEVIVVAIDHGGDDRNHEYNFTINAEYNFGGKGAAYADFLAETLKPYIDSHYRTVLKRSLRPLLEVRLVLTSRCIRLFAIRISLAVWAGFPLSCGTTVAGSSN